MARFAANLSLMFQEHAFPDRFAAARDAGFAAVEFQFPYAFSADLLAEKLAASGLELTLFNLPPGDFAAGERGLAAIPGREADFRTSLDLAMPYVEALKPPRLHLMAGIAPKSPESHAAYRASLAHACDRFADRDLTLVIEPINGTDMPGYFLDDFDLAARILDEMARANLGLMYDIYHRQMMRGDVIRGLRQLYPLIAHVQVASVPGRHEPLSGELDDRAVFAALDALGHTGFVGCEYVPAKGTVEGLEWLKRLG